MTKAQIENLKTEVAKYEKWLKHHEEDVKIGHNQLQKVKTCAGSSGQNWANVLNDVDKIFAQAYREEL
jgi:hypothetical protein